MKIQTKFKPELIVSRDETRYAITEAYLTSENGKSVLVCTDGRRLVILPVERSDGEPDGHVGKEALKLAKSKRPDKRASFVNVELSEKTHKLENGWVIPREDHGMFPAWEKACPEFVTARCVCLNARFLWEIAQAMGCDCVNLELSGSELDPIRIQPNGSNSGERAILMPLRMA